MKLRSSNSNQKSLQKDKQEVVKPTKKLKQDKGQSKGKVKAQKKNEQIDKDESKKEAKKVEIVQKQMKKVIVQGSAPVDAHFPKLDKSKVVEKDGVVYSAILNQSNVVKNNNKFYVMQILQSGQNDYTFFCRWGRVGVPGQISQNKTSNLMDAIQNYETKLKEKLKNGYIVVDFNYDAEEQENKEQPKEKKNEPQSQLHKKVQDLIRLIFDMKMMNQQMKQIGYDAKKMPLGKLSKSSIEKGYEALQKLMNEIKGQKRKQIIEEESNNFYSRIPHDVGYIKMQNFILDTEQKIKNKLEMLQSLEDIQVYTKILNQGKISNDISQIDSNYMRLKTQIQVVDKSSPLYQNLLKCVKNTHASTHNNYTLEVEEIYRLSKKEQNQRYKEQISNKQLLWHGSRLTNFVGILSQGLRIAPPEAPVTGYMFGKGVYFADMVSKSANYCCTSKTNNTGLMLLCEVALGNCWEKYQADYYASNLPPNMNSTKGVGRTAPHKGETIEGAWAPCEKVQSTGVNHTALLYNEYIVYDVSQIKSKFLFKMKFHYN